ncbi:hypothetical protein [Marinomonas balearica]|uniref:Uncharacterized protein n=1 Tax=Marinomonas balearica TaxID=491947 RepID=A0A4R6M7K5_9GAMM|nr:hypothetical protein [Marinomonas balearica]TDO97391.1 hypothetical protein DFP79_2209 [Marinomonas balearica]
MFSLLLWLDQKAVHFYNRYLEAHKRKVEKRRIVEAQQAADSLPDYLKRDMGISPSSRKPLKTIEVQRLPRIRWKK